MPLLCVIVDVIWLTTPSPVVSDWVVTFSRFAEMVVTELSRNVPSALVAVTVSVVEPSAFSTVTSVCVTSAMPSPVSSISVVFDSPFPEVVVTVESIAAPFEANLVNVSVLLPSAFRTVTSVVV